MKNVVGYVRVSTQGQARDGYSLQYQVDEIIKYCDENNLNLIRIYEDRGISGAKVDEEGLTVERESLQNMLADLGWEDKKGNIWVPAKAGESHGGLQFDVQLKKYNFNKHKNVFVE